MKFILDTNTLSFAMAGDEGVTEQLLRRDRTEVLLPQPVIAEIEYGLSRLPASKKKTRLSRRFRIFSAEIPRADWTDEVSRSFGCIKAELESQGARIEDFDVAVAAHALSLGATLVTDNLRHMGRISDLRTENWKAEHDDG